ncbi:hypothetical protein OAJ95_00975 [Pelagibacteraceae bacterium]|nr:hypothetical protein [Pelagibacteraceae bacterium]
MKKNFKKQLYQRGQTYFQDQFNYVSYVTCPDCNSHYLRCPDKHEFKILVNNKKVENKDYNYTNICEECSKVFVEKFEDDDPNFEVNSELYYASNELYR